MNRLFRDFILIFFTGISVLAIQDAFPRTKQEMREARHAREAVYQSCVSACMMGCAREPK